MTLILAGHAFDIEEDWWPAPPEADRAYVKSGLFVLSDSAISTNEGRTALDNDFRKIRHFEVKVREPQFYPDGGFNRYGAGQVAGTVHVAFAGSSLSAQAVFERAAERLSDLRVSCERSSLNGALIYVLRSADQPNPLTDRRAVTTWDDDTFTPADMAALSIHDAAKDCLKRAIEDTFAAKKAIATSREQFQSWMASFVSATWCARSATGRLQVFRLSEAVGPDAPPVFSVSHDDVPERGIAVLGMQNEFETAAQDCFNRARETRTPTFDAMRDFMQRTIQQHRAHGKQEIGLPIREVRLPVKR